MKRKEVRADGPGAALDSTNSHTMNDLLKEGIRMRVTRIVGVGVLLVVVSFLPGLLADPLMSGYDLFETNADGTFADLSGPAALVNIPFSGPPEKVQVRLTGVPIKSFRDREGKEQKDLGTTDTVIERIGEVPEGGSATVQLRMVALSLHGIFTDNTGRNWEVQVTQSEKQPSTGTMTIVHNTQEGGTFTAKLTVVARFVFTSGSEQRVLDPAPPITFESVPLESGSEADGSGTAQVQGVCLAASAARS